MSRKSRVDFSKKTKKLIGTAVNWQCSVPFCRNPAVGADKDTPISAGTACHIFSAAENGPRGRGGLSDEELASASNGIWCCAFHGRAIDANQGKSFPAALLHMWKRLAEGRVRRAMAVQFAELGWFEAFSLTLATKSGRSWEPSMRFRKNNLLRGRSGDGKSLLMEAIASASSSRHTQRLRQFPKFVATLQYETLTIEGVLTTGCDGESRLRRCRNGVEVIVPPPEVLVLYLPSDREQSSAGCSDVGRLSQTLDVDLDVLHGLAKLVSANPNTGVRIELRNEHADEGDSVSQTNTHCASVHVSLNGSEFWLPFNSLSEGEKIRVELALLIALAREEVKFRPVLLCIDALYRLDDLRFRNELRRLAEEHIQLLVVAPHSLSDERVAQEFPGWIVIDIPSVKGPLEGWGA